MSGPLILSIFPGIDLLGRAFEEEWPEACIVRGPDLIFGGDIRAFHPPAGKFDGVIGGPPCQAFSRLRFLVEHNGYRVAENLIPEFERCVAEAQPAWFLMENVPDAPSPSVAPYIVTRHMVTDAHVGGETMRRRAFHFGRWALGIGRDLEIEWAALHTTQPYPAVCASGGGRETPEAIGGSGRRKGGGRISKAADLGYKTQHVYRKAALAQGLPIDFLADAPFTVAGKIKVIGNGVPMALGRAIAKAARQALAQDRLQARHGT